MAGAVEQYKEFAAECLRLARQATDSAHKARLLEMAEAWQRLARDLDKSKLAAMTSHVKLADVPRIASDIVAGRTRGRIVVDI